MIFIFGLIIFQTPDYRVKIYSKYRSIVQNGKFTEDEDGVKIYWSVNGMKQEDPVLIEFIQNNVIVKPDNLPLKLFEMKDFEEMGGQFNQSFEAENVLGLKTSRTDKKGFFIEAGAASGEGFSNSLLFEVKYQFTGLLVEPNPDLLKGLYDRHRNAYILPHCLSTKVTRIH